MAKKKGKGKPAKKAAPKKPGRDFRGFKRSTGEYDNGPGPIAKAMGVAGKHGGKPC